MSRHEVHYTMTKQIMKRICHGASIPPLCPCCHLLIRVGQRVVSKQRMGGCVHRLGGTPTALRHEECYERSFVDAGD